MGSLYIDNVKTDKKIKELRVIDFDGTVSLYKVGNGSVSKINFSAGTSGTEYTVEFKDGEVVQFRGYFQYQALWS